MSVGGGLLRRVGYGDLLAVGSNQMVGLTTMAVGPIRLFWPLNLHLLLSLLGVPLLLLRFAARVFGFSFSFVGFSLSCLLLTPCFVFCFAALRVRLSPFVLCFALGLIRLTTCFFRCLLVLGLLRRYAPRGPFANRRYVG